MSDLVTSAPKPSLSFALALAVPVALTAALVPFQGSLNLASDALLFVVGTVLVAAVGGLLPALVSAVAGSLMLNFFFTPPFHTFVIAEANNVLALAIFLLVAAVVASVVDRAARHRRRLDEVASREAALAETDRLRTALLQAVSHDLRAPLGAAKASVTAVLSTDLERGEQRELLAGADRSLDRLTRLVANLLDLSRLQAGAMPMALQPTDLSEVLARTLTGTDAERVETHVPEDLPLIHADPGLIERALANLVGNALKHADSAVVVEAGATGADVHIRIIDHGRGIPLADRERMFVPFQRGGDATVTEGTGLGLALCRGLVEAMGGRLDPETTLGGGLTMTVTLPMAHD